MILGHLAVAGIAKRRFLEANFLFLVLASYGPDLIDKPAWLALNAASKSLGHSLLVLALIAAPAWCFRKQLHLNKQLFQVGVALWLSHLATDLVELKVLLWPFLGPSPEHPYFTFMERLRNYYLHHQSAVQLSIEISFIIIALVWWIPYFLRNRPKSPATLIEVEVGGVVHPVTIPAPTAELHRFISGTKIP
jgi:hypothetical protein